MRADLHPLEMEIARGKRELNELFREESLAARRGDFVEAGRRHVALLEKELENVRTIARYLEPISAPVARDLSRWQTQTSHRFREVEISGAPAAIQRWVVQDLVPLLRRSEQAAHLVATSVRVQSRKAAVPFVWPVAAAIPRKDAVATGSSPRPTL